MTHSEFHSHRLCIAPMLDWTDRHARFFLRQISPHARMYTEMVTTGAILHGNAERHLAFDVAEKPIALQLGGSNPQDLYEACRIAQAYPYDEINLNVGCPSDRVQSGRFGACLMADAKLVADCIKAMQDGSSKLITVKCRIGIDELDSVEFLQSFIATLYDAGCRVFIIHARKAWLSGLSPKENREIPPLHYDRAYLMKQLFPDADIIVNGGITTAEQSLEHVRHCDGVMIGREAYQNPYSLIEQEKALFGTQNLPTRERVIELMLPYIEQQIGNGSKLHHITRHMIGLFNSQPGGKAFRRHLSTHAHKKDAGISVLHDAVLLTQQHSDEQDNA